MTLSSYTSHLHDPLLPLSVSSLDNSLLSFSLLAPERRDRQDMYSRPPISIFCTIAGKRREETVLARRLANELSIIYQVFFSKGSSVDSSRVNRAKRIYFRVSLPPQALDPAYLLTPPYNRLSSLCTLGIVFRRTGVDDCFRYERVHCVFFLPSCSTFTPIRSVWAVSLPAGPVSSNQSTQPRHIGCSFAKESSQILHTIVNRKEHWDHIRFTSSSYPHDDTKGQRTEGRRTTILGLKTLKDQQTWRSDIQ